MFMFYHSQQNDKNKNYYTGILFESLLQNYLEESGYTIKLRRKYNSLEYDLEGNHVLNGDSVIGEAKAHENAISGQVFTSFVGKLLPLGLTQGKVKGLFLSTSSLTSEAHDYYQKVQEMGIRAITGNELFNSICKVLKLPKIETLYAQLREQGFTPQSSHILRTENGTYVVIVAGNNINEAPSYFAVFQTNGRLLCDVGFADSLAKTVRELQALQPITTEGKQESTSLFSRTIAKGLAVGTTWIDYRLPAGPKHFVGRVEYIDKVTKHISEKRSSNIIQVKSRSGVGKSSVLSVLAENLEHQAHLIELHDARDIKSILDFYSVLRRFTNSSKSIHDLRGIEVELERLTAETNENTSVFLVDQFESTFTNPSVFQAYESLAVLLLSRFPNIYMIIARKNDQLTTYDDSLISLEKINGISTSYLLSDFTTSEAVELIEKINISSTKPVGKDVLSYVQEFSQGFPWLIKRTMAHIVKLVNEGTSQQQLFATALKLDDLFDEELADLDELERDYLSRIAARLPADYNQLQRQFDEDPILTKVLDKLTTTRLLRLTGSTYDTYNDVFKEYLVYRKLPDFTQPSIYRTYPNSLLSLFRELIKKQTFSIENLEQDFNLSRGTAFNTVKELNNLNLIRREGQFWKIPQSVLDTYNQGRLGEYIRRQLSDNDIVSSLIGKVAKGDSISADQLSDYLKDKFPFVEANDKTWDTYSTILRSWLAGTRLLDTDNNGFFELPKDDRKKIIEDLGNLTKLTSMGRKSQLTIFLPNTSIESTISALNQLLSGVSISGLSGIQEKKSLPHLRSGGWLLGSGLSVSNEQEFREQAIKLFQDDEYQPLWSAARNEENLLDVFRKMTQDLKYTESTMAWRLKTLLNWAKELGIIQNKRYKYQGKKIG